AHGLAWKTDDQRRVGSHGAVLLAARRHPAPHGLERGGYLLDVLSGGGIGRLETDEHSPESRVDHLADEVVLELEGGDAVRQTELDVELPCFHGPTDVPDAFD